MKPSLGPATGCWLKQMCEFHHAGLSDNELPLLYSGGTGSSLIQRTVRRKSPDVSDLSRKCVWPKDPFSCFCFVYCTLQGLEYKSALLGEDGLLLKVCSGDAPEREVQHLGLRCMNNVLNRYATIVPQPSDCCTTSWNCVNIPNHIFVVIRSPPLDRLQDEDMIINILTMLMELLTGGLHGDALNRSRLVSGAMRCLQTLSKNKASQNTLKTLFSAVKGTTIIFLKFYADPSIILYKFYKVQICPALLCRL